jgi:hypothetical protein
MKHHVQNKMFPLKTFKRYMAIVGAVLIMTVLIIVISSASASISLQTKNFAGPETQFAMDIAYSYVGPSPLNASYAADNGARMSPASLNPSTIVFNITRLPGVKIYSCDAIIEFYDVKITLNTGLTEKTCYFIGTNYKASFSNDELLTLFEHINDITDSRYYAVIGDFEFNMTDNKSHISTPVGSYGCYSTGYSAPGLWTAGKPNTISVTVQRIGYITMSEGVVSIYKDQPTSNAKAMVQLSTHQDGFLHNKIVPTAELPQTDLFHPISK